MNNMKTVFIFTNDKSIEGKRAMVHRYGPKPDGLCKIKVINPDTLRCSSVNNYRIVF